MIDRSKRVVILADMADSWKDQRIVTVDMLGDEFLETVQTGGQINVHAYGTVEVA